MNHMKQTFQIEKLVAKSGVDTLKINEYYIHSKYNPIQEAEKIVNQFFKKGHKTILFGFGLGYIAEALRKKLENSGDELLIIDPIKDELVLNNQEIYAIYSFSELNQLIKYIRYKDIKKLSKINVICSPNYDKLFSQEYLKLLQEVKQLQFNQIIDLNTAVKLAVSWQENFIKNLLYLVNDNSIEKLKNKINSPVVLVSGGPSLNKQLELLKEVKERVVIIAAGSTISSLNHAGIKADFVVSIDPNTSMLRHFEGVDTKNITLIYMPENYYKIRELFNSAYSFVPTYDREFQSFLKNKFDKNLPRLGYGGSCANYAFAIISYITDNSPIAIIGQDLAYTGGKSHAIGNKNIWEPTEEHIKERGMFYTEGYYGDNVLTSPNYFGMKQSFEEINRKYAKGLQVYNCTEGGIKLEGFEHLSFKSFCETYCTQDLDKTDYFKETIINEKITSNLLKEIEYEKREILNLNRVLTDGLYLLKVSSSQGHMDESTNKRLNKIEKKVAETLPKLNIDKILQPVSYRVNSLYQEPENETEEEKFKRVMEMNIDFFKGIKSSIEQVSVFNNELLKKIKKTLGENENE